MGREPRASQQVWWRAEAARPISLPARRRRLRTSAKCGVLLAWLVASVAGCGADSSQSYPRAGLVSQVGSAGTEPSNSTSPPNNLVGGSANRDPGSDTFKVFPVEGFGGQFRASVEAQTAPVLDESVVQNGQWLKIAIPIGARNPVKCDVRRTRLVASDLVRGSLKLLEPFATEVHDATVTPVAGRLVVRYSVSYSDKETGSSVGELNAAIAIGPGDTIFCSHALAGVRAAFDRVTMRLFQTATSASGDTFRHYELWVPDEVDVDHRGWIHSLSDRGGGGTSEKIVSLQASMQGGAVRFVEVVADLDLDAHGEVVTAAHWARDEGPMNVQVGAIRTGPREYALRVVLGKHDEFTRLTPKTPLTTMWAQAQRLRALGQGNTAKSLIWTEFGGVFSTQAEVSVVRQREATRRAENVVDIATPRETETCWLDAAGRCERLQVRAGSQTLAHHRAFVSSP